MARMRIAATLACLGLIFFVVVPMATSKRTHHPAKSPRRSDGPDFPKPLKTQDPAQAQNGPDDERDDESATDTNDDDDAPPPNTAPQPPVDPGRPQNTSQGTSSPDNQEPDELEDEPGKPDNRKQDNKDNKDSGGPVLNPVDIQRIKEALKKKISAKKSNGVLTRNQAEIDKRWKKAYDAMKKIATHVLLISKIAIAGAPVGHLLGIFIALVDTSVKEKGDIWNQIKHKVDAKISKTVTRYHFEKSQGHFKKFDIMAKMKKNSLDINDLIEVLSAKHDMLPYNFKDLGYDEELATLLPTWAFYMTSFTWEVMSKKNGGLDECACADQLTELRGETVKAAKSLFRKRYKNLVGVMGQKFRPTGCTGMNCFWKYHLTFKDSYDDSEKTELLSDVPGILSGKQREMKDKIFNILVDPVNQYFTEGFCGEGCNCPEPITREEIDFEYPKACYGTVDTESKSQCTLPCQDYNDPPPWCPFIEGQSAYRFEYYKDLIGSHWERCNQANWDTCMPL